MTVRPLDHDFPLHSDLSRRPPHEVDRPELLTELNDELARRHHAYPGLVDRGTLKPDDANHHIAVWRALIDDHHRAEQAAARHLGAAWHHPAGAWVFDWPTRIRELRRELALRRAAYAKWVASPTNPLTAADAARKLERLDALHHRYWADLFSFSPPEVDRYRDPARAAWAAAAERRRQAEHWRVNIEHARIAPRIGKSGPFDWAVHQSDCWRLIEFTARAAAGEDIGFAQPDHRDLAIATAEADRRVDQAYAQHCAGEIPAAELTQLDLVARWLRSGDLAPTCSGIVHEERMAA